MTAAARLTIRRDGVERTVDVGDEATLGRARGQVVRIVEDGVAPEHARLRLGATWEIEALGGDVEVDGARLRRGGRAPLARGARIAIGSWQIVVDPAPAGAAVASVEHTASLARELVRDLLGGDGGAGPTLAIERGPAAGRTIALPPAPARVVFGRGEDADVVVLDGDLSRQHFAILRDDEGVRVLDLGSKNGTRVTGRDAPRDPPGVLLRAGDPVAAGATVVRLVDPAEELLRHLDGPAEAPAAPVPAPPPATPPALAGVIVAAAIATLAVVALIWLLV